MSVKRWKKRSWMSWNAIIRHWDRNSTRYLLRLSCTVMFLQCELNSCDQMLVYLWVFVWMFFASVFVCAHVIQLQLERDELEKTFTQNTQQVQDKADRKSMQLERRLEGLMHGLEKTQAQLLAVLSASNMDQTALKGVTNKIEVNFLLNMYCMHIALCTKTNIIVFLLEDKSRLQ